MFGARYVSHINGLLQLATQIGLNRVNPRPAREAGKGTTTPHPAHVVFDISTFPGNSSNCCMQ
jgi:hypothetical protein